MVIDDVDEIGAPCLAILLDIGGIGRIGLVHAARESLLESLAVLLVGVGRRAQVIALDEALDTGEGDVRPVDQTILDELGVDEGGVDPGELFPQEEDLFNGKAVQGAGVAGIGTLLGHEAIHTELAVVLLPFFKGLGIVAHGPAIGQCELVQGDAAIVGGL